jgi:hypothetical protein
MKIYVAGKIENVGHICYGSSDAQVQDRANCVFGGWNSTIGDYNPVEVDWTRVYDASEQLGELLADSDYYDPQLQAALYSLYLDGSIVRARSMERGA